MPIARIDSALWTGMRDQVCLGASLAVGPIDRVDLAAIGIILVGLAFQLLRRNLPKGLGASVFSVAASVGIGIAAFHHEWPPTDELHRFCILGAWLAVLWSAMGRLLAGNVGSASDSSAYFAWALVSGTATAAIGVFLLVLATGLRMFDAGASAMPTHGIAVIAGLMAAVLIWYGSRPAGRDAHARRSPTMFLALTAMAVWWLSLMPASDGADQAWRWSVSAQTGLVALLVAAAASQELQYRSRRKRAWPDRLEVLLEPYSRWSGYAQTEAVIAAAILLLGVFQIIHVAGAVLVLPIFCSTCALISAVTCLFMAYRRWSPNTAGLGMALMTLCLVAAAAALAWPFYPAGELVGYAERMPVLFNAMLIALLLMAAIWYWLSRFWDQQLLDGQAWTTAGRMIFYARRTGFLILSLAALIAFEMTLWPKKTASYEYDGLGRIIVGTVTLLLLAFQCAKQARRQGSVPVATLSIAFLAALLLFVFLRLPASRFKGWVVQYDPVLLSALAFPVLVLARGVRKTNWSPFSGPLWVLALLILPVLSLLEILPPITLSEAWSNPILIGVIRMVYAFREIQPAAWVAPAALAILGIVFTFAGWREHRWLLLVPAAALLFAAGNGFLRL